jgi:drug/metabolite transporter (DMT)-like permease
VNSNPDGRPPANPFVTLADRPVRAAVLGALSIAFSAVLVRLSGAEPATAAIFRCLYALPLLGLLAFLERRAYGSQPAAQVRLAMIAGVFFAIDLVVWHHTIGFVGAGLATVLGNTQVVIVALLAWFLLGERPANRVLLAIPIVLIGVVLISGAIDSAKAYGSNPLLGVLTGLVTGLAYAGFLLVLRHGNADLRRPAGPLFIATAVGAVGSLLLGLPLGEVDLIPSWPAHGYLIALALSSQVVGWLLISVSLPRLPAALTSIVLTLQPVAAVMLGIVLLGEAPSSVQLAGAATILAGMSLAALGRPGRVPRAEPEIG